MLDFVGQNADKFTTAYGNIAPASIGAIQRSILGIQSEGGDKFFGEPAFDVNDLLDVENGKGVMSVLAADKLMLNPKLYSTFLLWLMTELYAQLPEVGDLDLPKLIFFFDEAHMLFDGTSKALVDKLQQVIRLIRSKGVGIYFITQSPTDIPDEILGQLGNRVQHALRAYTPKDQKAVRTAAETFRANPEFKTEDAIMNLETGEALVSFLDAKGAPMIVERAKMLFPLSQIGAVTEGQRLDIKNAAPSRIKAYESYFDRESAYEILVAQKDKEAQEAEEARLAKEEEKRRLAEEKEAARIAKEEEKEAARIAKEEEKARKEAEREAARIAKEEERARKEKEKEEAKKAKESGKWTRTIFGTLVGAAATSIARSVGNSVAKSITGSKSSSSKKSSTGGSILGKAAQSATKSATNKLTKEILKSIFK